MEKKEETGHDDEPSELGTSSPPPPGALEMRDQVHPLTTTHYGWLAYCANPPRGRGG